MSEPQAGQRIRLVMMPNDPAPLPPGSLGTVTSVFVNPGWLQIRVHWDSGRTLMLCSPPDEWELVEGFE